MNLYDKIKTFFISKRQKELEKEILEAKQNIDKVQINLDKYYNAYNNVIYENRKLESTLQNIFNINTTNTPEEDIAKQGMRRRELQNNRSAIRRSQLGHGTMSLLLYNIMGNGVEIKCTEPEIMNAIEDVLGNKLMMNKYFKDHLFYPALADGGRIFLVEENNRLQPTILDDIGYLHLDLDSSDNGVILNDLGEDLYYKPQYGNYLSLLYSNNIPAEECIHIKFNVLGKERLGNPLLQSALRVITWYDLAMQGYGERVRVLGNVCMIHSAPSNDNTGKTRAMPRAGSMLEVKQGEIIDKFEPSLVGMLNWDLAFYKAVACAMSLPLSLLSGELDKTSRASLEAYIDSIFRSQIQHKRLVFEMAISDIVHKIIKNALRFNLLKPTYTVEIKGRQVRVNTLDYPISIKFTGDFVGNKELDFEKIKYAYESGNIGNKQLTKELGYDYYTQQTEIKIENKQKAIDRKKVLPDGQPKPKNEDNEEPIETNNKEKE